MTAPAHKCRGLFVETNKIVIFRVMNVFIDGSYGTAGLRIADLVREDSGLTLLEINESDKKSQSIKSNIYKEADLIVLCLPEKCNLESILSEIPSRVKILDCSSKFRCDDQWTYGLPELDCGQRNRISEAFRVSNPGCYATAFILLVKPLIDSGLIDKNDIISGFSINGYSAGGKSMIRNYESGKSTGAVHSITKTHKHIPEVMKYTGLLNPPAFIPAVGGHKEGLIMAVPLAGVNENDAGTVFRERYFSEVNIRVMEESPNVLNSSFVQSGCEIYISNEKALLRMSNLDKGAAGAAYQNIKLMLSDV
jgi:N-acetyl-gamma-glutamyl-phosphate reductase